MNSYLSYNLYNLTETRKKTFLESKRYLFLPYSQIRIIFQMNNLTDDFLHDYSWVNEPHFVLSFILIPGRVHCQEGDKIAPPACPWRGIWSRRDSGSRSHCGRAVRGVELATLHTPAGGLQLRTSRLERGPSLLLWIAAAPCPQLSSRDPSSSPFSQL